MAPQLQFGTGTMQRNTEPCCRRFPLFKVLPVVGAMAVSAFAESPNGVMCPPSFQCSPRAGALLAQGVEQSEGLRSLVAALSSHPEIRLAVKMDRQLPGIRAHSELSVRFIFCEENGARRRKVIGVSGEVRIPYVAYAHQQIGLIAHELAHVMQLLRGDDSARTRKAEGEAVEIEAAVLAELDAVRDVERGSRRLIAQNFGESDRPRISADGE